MSLYPQPEGPRKQNELSDLIGLAGEIEHKFSIGRARDIRPILVQTVIDLSIRLQKKTKNMELAAHLDKINDWAYAILDNVGNPKYYEYLRRLKELLKSLREFR